MKKLNLLILTILLSCVALNAIQTVDVRVCQADKFLAGCDVYERADGDKTGIAVDLGDKSYSLNLSWGTPAEFAYTDSMAVGGTYIFNCQVLTEAGTYTETLTKADGCDSIVTLTLTEYIPCQDVTFAYTDSVKVGGSYLFGCDVVTLDGKTQDTFTRVEHLPSGCDSIITLTLKEYIPCQDVTFAYTDSVKVGGIYLFGCDAVTLDGKTDSTFTRVEQTASGCDSIITLTLKEYIPCQDVTFAYTDSVKVGGTYLFGCDAVTLDGKTDSTFTRVEHLASGCDSVITLTLKEYIPCQDVTFAYTDSVAVGGIYLFGCDAVTLDGKTDSTFTRVEQTASGCDSIITLTLKEYIPCQDVTFAYTDSVKVGGTYLFGCDAVTLDGKTDSTFTRVEQTASGCDSTITLTLKAYKPIVLDTLFKEVKDSVCDQEVYPTRLGLVTVIGHEAIYDSIFSDTIAHADTLITDSTIVIVDSIYKYSLKVWPKVVVMDTLRDTVLVDSLPYKWTVYDDHKISCDTAGIYHDTLDNDLGCDSIIYSLSLKVIGHDTIEVIVPDSNLCDGDVYKSRWQELTMVGREAIFDTTFNDTVIVPIVEPFTEDTIHDTIYMYHLYVWPKAVDSLQKDTILVDSLPYRWQVYEGRVISCDTAGTYHDTLDNVLGCDSVHFELKLKVIGHDTIEVAVPDSNLCDGDVYKSRWQELTMVGREAIFDTTFNDTVIVPIVEPFTEDTIHDTIYMYHLYVWPKVVVMPTKYDTALVDTLPYHWNTYTGKTIECYTADTYRDTAKNILDCDSIRYTLELAVIAHDTVTLPVEANLCLGESYTSRNQTVTPYSVGDTSFNDTVPSIMMEPLLMRDSIYAYTLTVQSRYVDNLPALVKDDSWLLMINRRSIREDYGINFTADQVHWYKVVGEVDEYPFGESDDEDLHATGDYYTVAAKMSGKYYALLDVDVSWKASCALYARTVILDCDNPQPVGPVLSPTFVSPGGLMKLTNLQQGETQLNVISPAGQLIRTEKVMNETEHELHAESVCGFYLLQVLNGGQKYVFKYVVTQ